MYLTKKDRHYMLFLYFLMLLIMGGAALSMHINTIVDELGMLANAAYLSGRDWHIGLVSSGVHYYKYGLAFIWFLPYRIFDDSVAVYKACGLLNAAFFSFIPVMAYYIARRYLKIETCWQAALLALVSSCIGDVMFYSLNMRADNMLAVLNWACVLTLLNVMHTDEQKESRKRILYSILLSFFAVYAYACHTRGIVTVLAVAMSVLFLHLIRRKKCVMYSAFAGSMAVFLVIDKLLDRMFRETVWQGIRGSQASTDRIGLLLTRSGIFSLIKTIIGWLYSSFTSTAGLVCVGLIVCLMFTVWMVFHSSRVSDDEGVLALYGGLAFTGVFLSGIYFFMNNNYAIFTDQTDKRLDRIVFGRYSCGAYGLIVLLAAYVLIWKKDLFGIRHRLLAAACYLVIFGLFVWKLIPVMAGKSLMLKALGVTGILKRRGVTYSDALIRFGILMCVVFCLILILSIGKGAWSLCLISSAIGTVLYGCTTYRITYSSDSKEMRHMQCVRETMALLDDIYEEYPQVYVGGAIEASQQYQVLLMDYDVMTRSYQPFQSVDNVFVVSRALPDTEALSPGFYYTLDDADYEQEGHDIVYIKGEALHEELESRGFSTSLYAVVESSEES